MPIYAYRCDACGFRKDVLQKMSDPALTVCPSCGAESFAKQLSAPAFQLKGTGWYVTDFRDKAKPAGAEAGAAAAGETSGAANGTSASDKEPAAKPVDGKANGKGADAAAAPAAPAAAKPEAKGSGSGASAGTPSGGSGAS
jgi:putative FmdB family regulatory protein